jgi:hypothetical protein
MGITSGMVILLMGIALVWFSKPNADGRKPAFLRNGVAEVLWPILCMVVLIAGVATIAHGLGTGSGIPH